MKKLLTILLTIVLVTAILSGCKSDSKSIVVGAKDFTEQDILGNILQILIEENTDIKVDYRHEMSSTVVFEALKSGDVDLYIDYTGTIYTTILNYEEMKSPQEIYDITKQDMKDKYQLDVLDPIGFNNTYTLSVRKDTAEKYNLTTYSDLAKVSHELIFAGTFELLNRPDGLPNLKLAYDMNFLDEKAMDGTLRYQAIANNEIQVMDAFSTEALLFEYELVTLEDDKGFFPPYEAMPIIRADTAEKYPELLTVLDKLTDALDDDAMKELNYKVDVLKENPKDVANEFLHDKGLI